MRTGESCQGDGSHSSELGFLGGALLGGVGADAAVERLDEVVGHVAHFHVEGQVRGVDLDDGVGCGELGVAVADTGTDLLGELVEA